MNLIQMSLSGAILIIVITLIRALLINHLPKKTFLVFWGIVSIRLLIPFSIPSVFSIYTLFKNNISTEIKTADITPLVLQENIPFTSDYTYTSSGLFDFSVWYIIWGIGLILCVLFFAVTYWKCYKEFSTSIPADYPYVQRWLSAHPLKRTISIRQSSLILAPLTYGIIHPVILMPKTTEWKNEDKLQYVLEHEYIHIKRFDIVTKLIFTITLCVHWFNPFVWLMYILANRDIELSCDESVLHIFGQKSKSTYAYILIDMEETKSGFTPICSNFSKNSIEERIEAIMKMKKTTALSIALSVSLVVGITVAFATSVNNEPNDFIMSNDTISYIGEDGKLYYVLKDGRTLNESEYAKEYPASDIVWWTYEEYKDWLENEKKELQNVIGQKAWANGKEFIWTQEIVDETIAMYEENLQLIKEGTLLSKEVGGDPNLMVEFNPSWSISTQVYEIGIKLNNGEEKVFGPYESCEELLSVIKPFCEEQVALGNMDSSEAKEIISKCK